MSGQTNFGVLLEQFFTQRLMQQRQASAHTIASYRDSFKMLRKRSAVPPCQASYGVERDRRGSNSSIRL